MSERLKAPTAEGRRVAGVIDHTLLRADATERDAERLCREAVYYGFCSVCVAPRLISAAVRFLRGSPVKPGTVVGFPTGAATAETKAYEAAQMVGMGALELDMVMAIGDLKSGRLDRVGADIAGVVQAACGRPVKVILETHWLTDEEKTAACRLAVAAGARFVKTSTGLQGGGATVHDVRLMRDAVGRAAGVKASGGIRTLAAVRAMLSAGADRIGTSSGVAIVTERAPA